MRTRRHIPSVSDAVLYVPTCLWRSGLVRTDTRVFTAFRDGWPAGATTSWEPMYVSEPHHISINMWWSLVGILYERRDWPGKFHGSGRATSLYFRITEHAYGSHFSALPHSGPHIMCGCFLYVRYGAKRSCGPRPCHADCTTAAVMFWEGTYVFAEPVYDDPHVSSSYCMQVASLLLQELSSLSIVLCVYIVVGGRGDGSKGTHVGMEPIAWRREPTSHPAAVFGPDTQQAPSRRFPADFITQ